MATHSGFNAIIVSGALLALAWAGGASSTSFQMTLKPAGTTSVSTPPMGPAASGAQADEIDSATAGDDADSGGDEDRADTGGRVINRSIARAVGKGSASQGGKKAKSNPEVLRGFDGVNFYEQRFSNNGNQFSVEPPDQGLCVGNGFVLESANDVLRIFDTAGNPKAGPTDLNTFYGYAPAIVRSPPPAKYGPSITDPSCIFDADTQRWFHVVLTLDRVGTTSALNGNNHLDIAVSTTSDPTGSWVIYSLPVQNNGTQGTPDHGCNNGFCLGDYPHIGADANGIYLTTNEFALIGPGFFYGVNVYAIPKHALASLAASVPVVLMVAGDLNLCGDTAINQCAFTVWPAQSAGGNHSTDHGGTEFFMSSLAVFTNTGDFNEILLWSLTNTQSLNSATPALALSAREVPTLTYGVPPRSNQKPGNVPLRDCLADTVTNCWFFVAGAPSPFDNPILRPDSNDSRMQQVYYANGKLWGALDTAVQVPGDVDGSGNPITRAGIAYFVLNPNSGKLFQQGIVAVSGNNVSYPAVAATQSGRGVMAFTLMGNDNHPSAAYTSLDAKIGAGDVHVVAAGAGPQDGFSGYRPFGTRPRWGDYGAAATDGNQVWIASEYIAQTCTYAAYLVDPTCGHTRAALGNWATRITQLHP